MTLEEAVQWCVDHTVDVRFDKKVVIFDRISDEDGFTLGRGATLIEAVQDARPPIDEVKP